VKEAEKEAEKEAVILLGHGSRAPGAGEGMERVAAGLRERLGNGIVAVCYMANQGPAFPDALENCVARGASKVVVIPYFLHAGMHIVQDVPDLLKKEAERFPGVELVLGKNLGFDDCLVDLVLKRVSESRALPGVRKLKNQAETSG
jgi:sirohydrochlorin ferrochelatase